MCDERREGIGQRNARTDAQRIVVDLDLRELAHIADVDDRRKLAQLFGNPQSDVGASREQIRIGVRFAQWGELAERRRRVVLAMPE